MFHSVRPGMAIVLAVASVACLGPVTWIATDGKRTTDEHTDGARVSLLESAAHDIPCAADQVTIVMGGTMGHDSLVTGCGKMCGYRYKAFDVTTAGWQLTTCTAAGSSVPLAH